MKNKSMGLDNNRSIRDAIQLIALRGLVSPSTGVVHDTARITGYVVKIHTDGEFAGTIDVQEFLNLSIGGNDKIKMGYHEGVYLSAIQDNLKGMVIVPKLYSEVTIVTDPETKTEYVSMFSHVDLIQLDSHEKVVIGVTEREEYDLTDEDAPDIDELEATGVFAHTTYSKNSIVSETQGKDSANHTNQTIDDLKHQITVGDDKSSQLIDQEKIIQKHGKSESVLGEDSNIVKHGSSSVTVEEGTVYLGNKSGVDDAVLGSELATILMDILNYISQIKTTTQLGPQPPLNMAQFIALKTKINAFKSSHSGFLTKKVQVQK
jgi:hypothetical protein